MTNTQELIRTGLRILGDYDTPRNYGQKADVLFGVSMSAIAVSDLKAFDAIQEMQEAAFRLSLQEIGGDL